MFDILNDVFPEVVEIDQDLEGEDDSLGSSQEHAVVDDGSNMHRVEAEKYEKLLAEAEREFFPGCGFSVLTSMVKLMHCKVLNHWTNKSFDMLLEILNLLCPKPNNIPPSFYASNKMLRSLVLGYEKIDACKDDCALFYKEHKDQEKCPECNEPRYFVCNLGDISFGSRPPSLGFSPTPAMFTAAFTFHFL